MSKSCGGRRKSGGRYHLLDVIRGVTIISMILYHASWDLVYIAGVDWPWYHTRGAHLWQQSICWSFILLSGLCMTLSAHKWKRGAVVFAAGLLVTGATLVFLPEDRVIFGVLTFLGSAMLVTTLLYRVLTRIPAALGAAGSALLFYIFYPVNSGVLTLPMQHTVTLPAAWYHGMAATFLGFTEEGFYSTDYFSFLPWIFLFWAGLYLGRLLEWAGDWKRSILGMNIPPLSFLGQHSLLIYLLHQPLLYMVIVLLQRYVM